ncbi:tRNA:m(4)X modification enzyme TRM13 homolog [Nasonia vitripennis]|uniref:tRNA:m(4)X modification enzyme TRM13 n=1 Tax=Nasonia vitripennis TaxID=7425 RepID=A0A7M7H6Q3_NASVI|nr:tRNA:m(4)X modification enzyme TRM13 homolog [Nasonia vitripennis]XP_008210906.1 tRNA:m(4)X modification enzyme TRM13 homolog [Nasonia vitripennis]XP_008210907.1 tRNA:m(4)X modification enzyme TRM13 homolog [Nasonia vitripennis]XP_008210910.1 tRNA:m(4)X modification enzyme TRM13 homolog [Nasonia vitripennis]XP_008210911.1 tRNA:m(4)X modification enzyme TRM13 homolog [Nasonia vitripennis]XP_008210912.1 tRNA:m(4)X modification enzyme TRM13 homolog [Nasonia vitripennis]
MKMTGFEHCQFFVERKKRYCRMSVKKGKSFCGEHESTQSDWNKVIDERIDCPLDPSHTIYKSKLTKHLKVCNAKVKLDAQPSYVVKGINLGETVKCLNDIPLSLIEQSVIDVVIEKIKNSFDKLPEIPEEILTHEVLKGELSNPTYGPEAKRHLLQTASLLGHLENADLVHENTCFIEFGAGRGKLTYWLAQATKNQTNSSILLIDRSSHRHKKDNKLKNEKVEIKVTRVRADIADLKLSDVPEAQQMQCQVAFAKHICGVATDLTLRCITNSIPKSKSSKFGMVIAFCCHHQCNCSHYVGHKYLEKEGFTNDEFPILCKIASWATCGIKLNKASEDSEREMLGRKVKTLLNQGRLEYLKSFGFSGRLVHYTTTDITLENQAIVATLTRESICGEN